MKLMLSVLQVAGQVNHVSPVLSSVVAQVTEDFHLGSSLVPTR